MGKEKLYGKKDDDGHPPELVLMPRTNEHQQSSNCEQTYQDLSQSIIKVRHQLVKIASELPDGGVKLKANLKRMEDDLNRRRNSIRLQKEHPKAKRFRTKGCPEFDTMACRASHRHDFSSTDENGEDIELSQSTGPSTSRHSTPCEEVHSDDGSYGVQGATSRSLGVEIDESLKVLAEAIKDRAEEKKRKLEGERKYTIRECMEIMDEMEPKIADNAYFRVLKVLQEKGWREVFLHLSDQRRRAWISSI